MKKSVEQIIQEKMPGFRIVKAAAADTKNSPRRVGRVSRSLDSLRKKYSALGYDFAGTEQPAGVPAEGAEDDVQIVTVVPTDDNVTVRGPGPRSVVVSTQSGEIIGGQG